MTKPTSKPTLKPTLNIVTALPSEARPVIQAFSLRAVEGVRGVRLFEGENIRLVSGGIGKAAAASGVGYLAGAFPEPAMWLNIGIAGHGTRPVGEVLMAHAVHEVSTGQAYYPPLIVQPPAPTTKILTVDKPERAYPEDGAYEMEGSAFMAAARRFQTAELVHCLKVVSDGPDQPLEALNRERIEELSARMVPVISELRRLLEPLAGELLEIEAAPEHEAELLGAWHFTISDRRALRRQLRRLEVLGIELPGCELRYSELFAEARRGRDVVRRLSDFLDRQALEARP